jgi:hypothetical protein
MNCFTPGIACNGPRVHGALSLALLVGACAGHTQLDDQRESALTTAELVGEWCGTPADRSCSGDEALWLQLRLLDGRLEGQMCENPNNHCYPLEEATLRGNQLTFAYSFGAMVFSPAPPVGGEPGPAVLEPGNHVDGTFVVSDDTMTGRITSSKCSCSIPRTFVRL